MEHITMSKKERQQFIVFEKVKSRAITQLEAALQLDCTERWVRKKYKRYLQDGAAGLAHQNRNRVSPKRWNEQEKTIAIDLLRSDWRDFGPTFAAEKLKELKDIVVSKETLRQAMINGGVWQAKRKRLRHRKRRLRRPMIGLMIQLDGSPHDWFEGRGPKCTLLVFIDDATSQLLWLEFVPSESSKAVAAATKNYIKVHGRPHSIYVDYGSVFSVNLNNAEREKKTQWERMMQELKIKVIHAGSPQAKGRVERSNGTLQDRLLKEMRLAGVSSIAEANQFLRESKYIALHNARFAVPAAQPGNAHKPMAAYDIDAIFCFKDERVLANDYTITFNKHIFQLDRRQPTIIRPKNIITVKTHLNGTIDLFVRKMQLSYKEIHSRPQKKLSPSVIKQSQLRKVHENSKRWNSNLFPMESRMKSAVPAVEAKKRN